MSKLPKYVKPETNCFEILKATLAINAKNFIRFLAIYNRM